MKKIFLILAVLMLAAPVMAEPNNITITATVVDSGYPAEVEITYAVTTGKIPRAFALDITVTAGTIVDIGNFFVGECNDSNGYGIFPANFNRYINADFNNWDDVNYTPVADVNDLPGDTEGGIGTGGITIEMGSLYDVSKGKGPPETSGILCSIFVDSDCHVDLALNVGRAGVVMEDGNQPDDVNLVEEDVTVVCTVPDVEGDVNLMAQVTIQGAGFGIGDITTACSVSIADGNVISQTPGPGATTCGTDVNLVVSTGPLFVPDVLDMDEADAIAAIDAVTGLTAGAPTYACSDTIADGNVISTTPVAGPTCDATVDIVVSTGSPTVPNVLDMNEADAIAAINAVSNLSVGTVSYDCDNTIADGNVISQIPTAGPAACDATVDLVVSTGLCCLKNSDSGFAVWVDFGKPDCWCYKKQCRGDINGTSAFGRPVSGTDNDDFKLAFNKTDTELKAITSFNGICADLNHTGAFGKRVTGTDNDDFKDYFNVAEASVPQCASTHINFWTN